MSSPLDEAINTLYGGDPDTFTERRDELSAAARTAGDAEAGRQIGALRKPVRAAWLINRLVRDRPEIVDELVGLGGEIRKAQRTMDGAQLRELTVRRRRAISAATQAALTDGGSETLRAGVTSTFEAALADAEIAAQVRAGALVRPIEWSGFGDATPSLTLVPPPAPTKRAPKAAASTSTKGTPGAGQITTAPKPDPGAAARRRAREKAIADAEQELADAETAVGDTETMRVAANTRIETLEADLVQARLDLRAAGAQHRSAQNRRRDADRRLRRVRGASG